MDQTNKKAPALGRFKKVVKAAVFLLLMAVGVHFATVLLYPMNDITKNWAQFYAQDSHSVQILIVGGSHAYSSFDPAIMEDKSGKTTYMLASSSQTAVQSYFDIKEALHYQKPDIIILEAYSLGRQDFFRTGDDTPDREWVKESNIDGMRFGATKIEAVVSQYYPSNWAYALLPLARCHGNWKNTGQIADNLAFLNGGVDDFSTYRPSQTSMSEETAEEYVQRGTNTVKRGISAPCEAYFRKTARLCADNGVQLYVVMAPMYDVYIKNSAMYDAWSDQIAELTAQCGVPYIDCNRHYDEIGLVAQDFEDAYSDFNHMNAAGGTKFTNYIAEVLFS